MRKVIVGFSKPKNKTLPIYSWIIRAIDQSSFSHVYVKITTRFGLDLIYQASGVQNNFMGLTYFQQHAETVKEFDFEISDDNYSKLMTFCITKAGAPYSIKQAIDVGLFKLFGIKPKAFPDGFVCSELVGHIIKDYISPENIDPNLLTPKDIFRLCEKISGGMR